MVSVLLQGESWNSVENNNCYKGKISFPFRFFKRAHIIVVGEGTLFIEGGRRVVGGRGFGEEGP